MSVEAAPQADGAAAMSGALRDASVPELLWRLHSARATGVLELRDGDAVKSLWMTYGQPVFARSSLPGDRLTERLRLRGLLSPEEFAAVQVAIEGDRGERRIGQLLLEARLIPKRVLDESLHEQLLWILDSMLLWSHGQWAFFADVSCDEPVTLNVTMPAILMKGARDRLPLSWLRRARGREGVTPRLLLRGETERELVDLGEALRLDPSERLCLRRLDGSQSLRAMLNDFETDERELLSLVYTLQLIGKLQLEDTLEDAPGAAR
ncbi:MAG: DUF4388 domain-containing protein [Myxococcales bacterium]|nr:DUF4388 domain-containing protein [Myxococcales bacterium]